MAGVASARIDPQAVDFDDAEYTIPGELAAWVRPPRRVEAWPEQADRRLAGLEGRVRRLEGCLQRISARSDDSDFAG